MVDYVNGFKRAPADQAALLAARSGVPAAAAKPLHKAILSSSQIVLLTFQQFWLTSAYDGFLNRGRYSLIQEPFYYYPTTELNHQARRPMWNVGLHAAWITKTIDSIVTPENQYQYILDFVDPAKPKAKLDPGAVAKRLQKAARDAVQALRAYERAAGAEAAAKLAPFIRNNAVVAEYAAREIRAAIAMYPLFFARTRASMVAGLKKGLAELEPLAKLVANRTSPECKMLFRVTMIELDPKIEIALARALLEDLQTKSFPQTALTAYVASRRNYNEIRRVIRPFRSHNQKTLEHARICLKKALACADAALAGLQAPENAEFARNVGLWRDYLIFEQQGLTPPAITCDGAGGEVSPLRHHHAFRAGEDFLEDFLGFFRPLDYKHEEQLFISVSHTPDALAVTLRENTPQAAARRASWAEQKGTGNDSYIMHVSVDVENQGRESARFIVWPEGSSVSLGSRVHLPVRTDFKADDSHWETTVWLPYKLLGRKPRKGEVWGLNVTSSPYIRGSRSYTWAPQYDCDNPKLYGKVKFV